MSTHTPGPWSLGRAGKTRQRVDADGRWWSLAKVVIAVDGLPSGEGLANARLIAAAPDLLAAILLFVGDNNKTFTESERMDKARAAIAKATGEGA